MAKMGGERDDALIEPWCVVRDALRKVMPRLLGPERVAGLAVAALDEAGFNIVKRRQK